MKKFLILLMSVCLFLTGCDTVEKAKTTGIVVVGMEKSAKYGSCPGAALDANNMANILSKYGKVTKLLNSQATKANVLASLNVAAQNDLLIFFYSGHGGSDKIGDVSDEPDGKNEYLCLYNAYLLDNEIWNVICNAKGRVFCIFDCCHSETMFRTPFTFADCLTNNVPRGVNMLCWSGCPDDNYSYGSETGGDFSNAILKSYKDDRSYDKVWELAKMRANAQNPKRTQIGKGFGGKIFR